MQTILAIVLSVFVSSQLFAGDITECSDFQIPVNYDAVNFKLKHESDPEWGDKYFYLLDQISFRQNQDLFVKGSIAVILKANNVAVIQYQEAEWKKVSDTEYQFVRELNYSEFDTTWSHRADKFEVSGVGNGQSAKCYEDGYDAYFTFTNDLGSERLSGLRRILHYGHSNVDPLE